LAIRDMRHVVNGERRSHASKVLTGAFVPCVLIMTLGGGREAIGAPNRRIEQPVAQNIESLASSSAAFRHAQAMVIRAMTYDRTGSVTLCRRRVRPQHRACYSEECNGRDCKHDQKRLWNQFRECPVNPWGRWRSHRHEDRISCCNCDSCRWYWTGDLLCRLAFARKAAHACRRPIGYSVSRVRGSVLASVRWLTA